MASIPEDKNQSMIRVNVSAAIVRDDQILVIEFSDNSGYHYNLPGGGVEEGETILGALEREVKEETGVEAVIGPLLMVWEQIRSRGIGRGPRHKIGLIYSAVLKHGQEPDREYHYDKDQIGVRWIPLDRLPHVETINTFGAQLLDILSTKKI
jgi:8-oxo-dGTP diphosphatase